MLVKMAHFSPCFSHIYQICGKICHDIAAPLSAISLGLEILEEDSRNTSHLELVKNSIKAATDKLKILRCLYGYANSFQEKPTLEDIKEAIAIVACPTKYEICWHIPNQTNLKGEGARLLFCCLLLAFEAIPRGGRVSLNPDFSISCEGANAHLSPIFLDLISSSNLIDNALPPRESLGLFSFLLAQSLDVRLQYTSLNKNEFKITIQDKRN